MRYFPTLVVSFGLLLLAACQTDKKVDQETPDNAPLDVQLICEATSESVDPPQNGVFIIVNESKTKIADVNACDKIDPADYATYDIPKDAIIAVGGWWAGGGDYFYVLRKEGGATVYHAQVDEAQEVEGYRYIPAVTYQDGKFSFEEVQ